MSHRDLGFAAAALVLSTAVCFAQPAGITPDMIATSLPLEGAPRAVTGSYGVLSEGAFGSPGHRVYRPRKLDAFPTRDTLPVVIWGNGGCGIDGTSYAGFLTTIASHGFLVIGTAAARPDDSRRRATADDLRAAVDWADTENTRAGSPLNGKIATDKVAVMGHSCGGRLSIDLGADPRVATVGVFNAGVQANARSSPPRTADALEDLHGPVLLINGHERDFAMAASHATFELLDHVPAFYGARHEAGHTATLFHPGGGEFANVAAKWVRWILKGDPRAALMFTGKNCNLCKNRHWDVEAKGLPE